jgi:NaMN:DMB phosphoribosyltransferase
VVREGVGAGGEMTQALYAHMSNKTIKKKKKTVHEEYILKAT